VVRSSGVCVCFRAWDEVHRLSGASKGYKGVIQRILLNGKPLPISSKLPDCSFDSNRNGCAFDVGSYDGLPCPISKNPCLNNGLCIPELDQFICKCPPNTKGKYCEICKIALSLNSQFYPTEKFQLKRRPPQLNLTEPLFSNSETVDIEGN
jgi:hypothetical protein